MNEARSDPKSAMYSDEYKACFGDIDQTADAYLSPN
jgi:hypothetical protein